jgi:hypothetical protein
MTTKFLRGMCYSAFPSGYNPSTANNTCIFFGSDIATKNLKPLWGKSFTPTDGPDKDKIFLGRDDILTMANMGVNLIRLYDWDPRNDHKNFLDYCHSKNIKVLVPVSNYNLGAFGTPPNMDESIKGLLESFTLPITEAKWDKKYDKLKENTLIREYHPAIAGIIIGSELDLPSQMPKGYLAKYTKRWVEIEDEYFPKRWIPEEYRTWLKVPIGHPVSFAKHNGDFPCFEFWDNLLNELKGIETSDLHKRLMLCPQSYNEASYLFENAEGKGKGWVDIAYEKYNLPILFTEIGCSRLERGDYNNVIAAQLERSYDYQKENPQKLLGTCFFQFCDKVWMEGTTEGSFGVFTNTKDVDNLIRYGAKDFTHTDGNDCTKQSLKVQVLFANPVYNTIKLIYKL